VVFEEGLPFTRGGFRTCATHVVATYCLTVAKLARAATCTAQVVATYCLSRDESKREKRLLSFFAETTANESSLPHRGYCKSSRKLTHLSQLCVLGSALQLAQTEPAHMRGYGMHSRSAPLEGMGGRHLVKYRLSQHPPIFSSSVPLPLFYQITRAAGQRV
jgi:hypothetical protein